MPPDDQLSGARSVRRDRPHQATRATDRSLSASPGRPGETRPFPSPLAIVALVLASSRLVREKHSVAVDPCVDLIEREYEVSLVERSNDLVPKSVCHVR